MSKSLPPRPVIDFGSHTSIEDKRHFQAQLDNWFDRVIAPLFHPPLKDMGLNDLNEEEIVEYLKKDGK